MYLPLHRKYDIIGRNVKSVKQARGEEKKESDNLKKRSEYDEGHRLDGPEVVERNGIIRTTSYMMLSCIDAIILKNSKILHERRTKYE